MPRKVEVDLSEILIQPHMLAQVPAESPRLRNILVDLHTRTIGKWVAPLYIFTSTLGVVLIANFWLDYTDSGIHFHRWLNEWIQGHPPKVVAHSNAIVSLSQTTPLGAERLVTQSLSWSNDDLLLRNLTPTPLAPPVSAPVLPPPPVSGPGSLPPSEPPPPSDGGGKGVVSPPPVSPPPSGGGGKGVVSPPPVSLPPSGGGGGGSLTQLDKLPPQAKPAAPAVARLSTIIKKTDKPVSHSKAVSHKPTLSTISASRTTTAPPPLHRGAPMSMMKATGAGASAGVGASHMHNQIQTPPGLLNAPGLTGLVGQGFAGQVQGAGAGAGRMGKGH
jgi:U5 snRNP spliceosome subunit